MDPNPSRIPCFRLGRNQLQCSQPISIQMPQTYLFADNRTVHRGGKKLIYIPMFAVFQEGRTSTDQSDRKGLDGELKNGLRRIEERKKAEYTN